MNTPNTTLLLFRLFRLYACSHVNYSCMDFFFLVLPRSLFLMVCLLVSRRSEKWSCRMRNPLDSEGWVSILQLARHRRNTNSFDKSSRLSFTHHWYQFRTWFFMITGKETIKKWLVWLTGEFMREHESVNSGCTEVRSLQYLQTGQMIVLIFLYRVLY